MQSAKREVTRELLYDLYVEQQKPVKTIAKELGFSSHTSVRKALQKFGIEARPCYWNSRARQEGRLRTRKGCHDISGSYWSSLRAGARVRHIPFEITIEDAWTQWERQGGICALSGERIELVAQRLLILKGEAEQTASLDRIDSRKGYTPDNIQWVHKIPQRLKLNTPNEDFIDWCAKIASYHKSKVA